MADLGKVSLLSFEHRPLLLFEPDALQEFEGIPQSEPHDSVVIGLSPSSFHYDMVRYALSDAFHGSSVPKKASLHNETDTQAYVKIKISCPSR